MLLGLMTEPRNAGAFLVSFFHVPFTLASCRSRHKGRTLSSFYSSLLDSASMLHAFSFSAASGFPRAGFFLLRLASSSLFDHVSSPFSHHCLDCFPPTGMVSPWPKASHITNQFFPRFSIALPAFLCFSQRLSRSLLRPACSQQSSLTSTGRTLEHRLVSAADDQRRALTESAPPAPHRLNGAPEVGADCGSLVDALKALEAAATAAVPLLASCCSGACGRRKRHREHMC